MSLAGHETTEVLPVQALFSYDVVDAETRGRIRMRADEIRRHSTNASQSMIEIGKKLIEVRALLPDGEWGRWLASEFGWSRRQASLLIRSAEVFGDIYLDDISVNKTTLHLLAAPTTPPEVQQEAKQRLLTQGSMSLEEAKEILEAAGSPLPVTYERGQKDARGYKQRSIIANELHHAARNLQVALLDAYAPLNAPVRRALQRIFDLAVTLENETRPEFMPPRLVSSRKTRGIGGGRYWGVQRSRTANTATPWQAYITITQERGKPKALYLGSFATEEEAARAYDAKAREYRPATKRLNFPDEAR